MKAQNRDSHAESGVLHALGQGWKHLSRWHQLAVERHQLASMNDADLKDLGLSRADILQESERHFWEDPLARNSAPRKTA